MTVSTAGRCQPRASPPCVRGPGASCSSPPPPGPPAARAAPRHRRVVAAPVAVDDGRLERQRPQLGHLQLDLPGLGLQLAALVPGPRVLARLGALVLPGPAQDVALGIEQGVEGLLDGAADHAVEVLVDLGLVDLYAG